MAKKPKIIFGRIFWKDATLTIDAPDNTTPDCMCIKENYGIIFLSDPRTVTVVNEYDTNQENIQKINTRLDIPKNWAMYIEQCVGVDKWKKVKL